MTTPARKPFRLTPAMPTQNYQTFAVRSPINTHYRRATCAEIDCPDYLNGWYLKIDGTPQELIHIATHSGRRYRVGEVLLEGQTEAFRALIFEAGQPCFREETHVTSLERPEFFYIGRGDFRSFSTRRAQQVGKPDEFVDRFATHLDKLKTKLERG